MFATDRDLLALEPNLFRDLGWIGQRLLSGTAAIAGETLTISAADTDFAAARIGEGFIILVDATPYEIIDRPSPTTVTISRLRPSRTDLTLPPSPASGRPAVVMTFRPQIWVAHTQVLRMLGIEPGDTGGPGPGGEPRIIEDDITNPGAIALVEALGALYLIFAAAAGPGGPDAGSTPAWSRMLLYRDRFSAERRRTAAHIDLDGDGLPDATRRMNLIQFVRS